MAKETMDWFHIACERNLVLNRPMSWEEIELFCAWIAEIQIDASQGMTYLPPPSVRAHLG